MDYPPYFQDVLVKIFGIDTGDPFLRNLRENIFYR
jgi:hypothetical protein